MLEEVTAATRRGRGGGGFRRARGGRRRGTLLGEVKYAVVNADEGDPGADMDRSLLEGDPDRVPEGLIIGAYVIGAREGFVYVREEHLNAVENLAVGARAGACDGLIGDDTWGRTWLSMSVSTVALGAFASGESSAWMAAIEGRVGEPWAEYVRTAVSGIWGKADVAEELGHAV